MREWRSGPLRVLAFGTYDTDRHPRVAVLIEGLRAHGADVRELNIPLRLDTAGRLAALRQPWRVPLIAVRLVMRWSQLTVRARQVRRRYRPQVILIGYLGHFDVRLARWLFRKTPLVLDLLVFAADTARDRGVGSHWKTALLDRIDRQAIRAADVVVLDTPANATLLPSRFADRALAVPVGASSGWFLAGAESTEKRQAASSCNTRTESAASTVPPVRVVFFGLFIPLQGTPVIAEALALLADSPQIETLIIGNGQDLDRSRQLAVVNSQVSWRDWVSPAELPSLVAEHDICLGIFGTTAKAARVVPNKVYQGAAAGCAIVTSDTGPQREALGAAGYYVPRGDPVALADALRTLASDRERLTELRAAAHARALAVFHPSATTRHLHGRLETLTTRRAPTTRRRRGVAGVEDLTDAVSDTPPAARPCFDHVPGPVGGVVGGTERLAPLPDAADTGAAAASPTTLPAPPKVLPSATSTEDAIDTRPGGERNPQ